MPDCTKFHCHCFRRENRSRKGKEGDRLVPGITFIISINIDIPLDSLLIASDNKCYELSFVRPIVDFDGHIIAVRCITV